MKNTVSHIHIGGLVGMGFDRSGKFLLVASHSGRGVFDTSTWERVARDPEVCYPNNGHIEGIGPLSDVIVGVQELDESKVEISVCSPDGRYRLVGESSVITIYVVGA